MKDISCCFTGHRFISAFERGAVEERLRRTLGALAGGGFRHFYNGGAVGFDTLSALAVLDFRRSFPDIRLHMVLPCKNQSEKWPAKARREYDFILSAADSVTYVGEIYTPWCMHERNRRLVDACSSCVCYMKAPKGGTAYTVHYAIRSGLDVINLAEAAD